MFVEPAKRQCPLTNSDMCKDLCAKKCHVCSQVLESRSVDEQTDLAQRGIDVAVTDTARVALVEFCSHSHW